MDHDEARAVLARAKDGQGVTERQIRAALEQTGDLTPYWQRDPMPTPMNVDDDEPREGHRDE